LYSIREKEIIPDILKCFFGISQTMEGSVRLLKENTLTSLIDSIIKNYNNRIFHFTFFEFQFFKLNIKKIVDEESILLTLSIIHNFQKGIYSFSITILLFNS